MARTEHGAIAAEHVSIQDMAKISGLSESTLRYYEKIGLIAPVPRDQSSGHRRYGAAAVAMIEALGCLRSTGMSVQDMRSYLRLMAEDDDRAARLRELFERNTERVDSEMERMRVRRRYLALKAELWAARERGDVRTEDRVTEELLSVRDALLR
ncbi:MerR family transcriptional regulator [Streptomyces justiciae]|uniref:MerR family transcriptional regulator n=1 Tax=Streptomyces justiciae TaxID=2780140 RepID=UPI001881374C|nr:MerR family transcriptional regulator [Streptomyces justiciae]MBE8475628.1 MerR family transcriptional regulator [Streptomyces justiciae]MCW8382552.1 MerR family transcriptional regulator [Streptomyces justiciae]